MKQSLCHPIIYSILILAFLIVVSCTLPFQPAPVEESSPTQTPVVIIWTATFVPASEPSTSVSPAIPSAEPNSPALATKSPPNQEGSQTVKIYLIAIEDNGVSGKKIGCDDSAVAVTAQLPQPTQAVLRGSLEALLAVDSQYYGESGLYNSLYESNLKLDKLSLENGEAIIHLKGSLKLGGVCDNPRVQAQLEETALQFKTVNRVKIFINGTPLDKALSGQG